MTTRQVIFCILGGIASFVSMFLFGKFIPLNWMLIVLGMVQLVVSWLLSRMGVKFGAASIVLCTLPFFLLLFGVLNGVFHLFFMFMVAVLGTTIGLQAFQAGLPLQRKSLVLLSIYLGMIVIAGMWGLPHYFDRSIWSEVEMPVPENFTLITEGGDEIHSSDWKGKIVVLNFWASWCKPCKEEMAELEDLQQQFKENTGVDFICVNALQGRIETQEKALKFIEGSSMNLTFALDTSQNLDDHLSIRTLPTTLISDARGNVPLQSHRL
jgi:thiol-disulfide isomerase/thioredoxin